MALLLLAVAAPAGFTLAGEATRPYVVVFDEDAVSKTVAETGVYLVRRPTNTSTGRQHTATTTRREVDGTRVRKHISEIQARIRIRVDNVYASALGGFSTELNDSQVRALQRDPAVAAILPDEDVSLDESTAAGREAGGIRTVSNPRATVPAGIRRVGAQRNSLARVDGLDTRVNADVAIIDTGVQRDHPDLNVVGGYNCTSNNRDRWDDVDGHGTHVAGIVGALDNRIGVVGVAPGARLWSVKVLGPRGSGRMSWLVCGIDWVTSQREPGNRSRPLFEVANMSISFGLPGSKDSNCGKVMGDSVHIAICRSVAKGTVYVVAAGNEDHNAKFNRPAAYDEVITVSAMADYDGRGGSHGTSRDSCPYWSPEKDDSFTSFSNFGPDVDLIAPGRCVLSTYKRSRYAWMSGTSMASPHVAGAAAVYRAMFPRATPQQVRLALRAVATTDWRTQTDPDGNPDKAVWIGSFREMPDFTATASAGSTRVVAGSELAINVSLNRVGGFAEPVSVDLVDPSTGISAATSSTTGTSTTLNVRVQANVRPGNYVLVLRSTSGDIERASVVSIVVQSAPPSATFTSVRTDLSFQSSTSFSVAWTEAPTGAPVAGRTLERLSGRVRTAGTCEDVRYITDYKRARTSPATDTLASGYCYRWRVTVMDTAGVAGTTESGAVLVDASAPRAPSVSVAGVELAAVDPQGAAVSSTYLGYSGMVWVRGGAAGHVDVDVVGFDPESGVSANNAVVARAAGWRAAWVGNSADGLLRLSFTRGAVDASLNVSTTNNAGLTGPTASGLLKMDSSAPSPVAWTSAATDAVARSYGTTFTLSWRGGSDDGAGVAGAHWVTRYRAPLNSRGECRSSSFSPDGAATLRTTGSVETGLAAGSCYAWGVRTLDNVGNAAPMVWSGSVVVERR